ncbi:MAG: FliM/FliN family flagellar motor switch protein [Planctomycetota bacterium]
MSELLTNDEIDTLLALFRTEGPPLDVGDHTLEAGPGAGPVVSEVDLLKPNRFSRDHIRAFERLFESTAKALGAAISDRLRLDMQCECVAVEQTRFGAWLKLVTAPSAIYVLKVTPFEVPVMFTATSGILYSAVDRILGGTGKAWKAPEDFTHAEYTVADAFVAPCLDRICESMGELDQLSWSIENRFCNPSMAQVLPAQDVLLSVHFQANGEHGIMGDLRLAMPFSALAPHLGNIELGPGSLYRVAPGSMRDTTSQTVRLVPMNLSVVLGSTQVPLRQLLALEVGDVVPLPTRAGDPVVAPVQGTPKFTGHVGTRGRQLAFRVESVLR